MHYIKKEDTKVVDLIEREYERQNTTINLIASENIASKDVINAQGSVLANKYAEGYPGSRYYAGCEYVDEIENIAIERAKNLFNVRYANVQLHSGTQANLAVYLALLKPYDTILGMSLASGGHLSHGAKVSLSGIWFNTVTYDVCEKTHWLDYDKIYDLANKNKPKIIIAGYSSYSRFLDYQKFRHIADSCGAYLLSDIAHISGIVAAGLCDNPCDLSDVVTSTTHKTLRGPRSGIILSNNKEIMDKINKSVFPGVQGGPFMHTIAAKAIAFYEASRPEFKNYMQTVIDNAKYMADKIMEGGGEIITGGTDNHLFLVDLTKYGITGAEVEKALESIGIICNKNGIPFDKNGFIKTSGLRIGLSSITSRGMGKSAIDKISFWILDVIKTIKNNNFTQKYVNEIRAEVLNLCEEYKIS